MRVYVFLNAVYWDEGSKKLDLSREVSPSEVRRIAEEQRGVLELVDEEAYDIMPHHVTLLIELCNGGESLTPAETYMDGTALIEKHQRRRDEIMMVRPEMWAFLEPELWTHDTELWRMVLERSTARKATPPLDIWSPLVYIAAVPCRMQRQCVCLVCNDKL